jgi:hypothetical protein
MTAPTQTAPPIAALRHSGWATKRTPLWVFASLVATAIAGFLVALSVRPSQSQRATDLGRGAGLPGARDAQRGAGNHRRHLECREEVHR